MQANPRSIEALFNSQLRYMVPMFQRLYVWNEKPQWETLWEDLVEKANLQLAKKTSTPHYLGALIIEGVRPSSPREVKRFLVIDGQQRLTTLQILLCSFRDIARKEEWRTLDRATTRYLENSDTDVMESPEEEKFKLWPTTLNRNVFCTVLSAGSKAEVERQFPQIKKPRKQKPEPRSNIVEGYLYFSQVTKAWITNAVAETGNSAEEVAFALLQAILQDFCVVEISLSEGDDSQEIFYSLNSQGRALSQSDLLRSLIFMRAEKESQDRDEIFKDYWSKFETDFWSLEVKRGGRSHSRLDMALRYFLMAKTGKMIDTRRVNEVYRQWITTDPRPYTNVRDELADLSRHGEAYQKYESVVPQGLPSKDLRRVLLDFDISTATPLILFLETEARLSGDQKSACLYIVESFLARRVFMGEENKDYNKLFVEVIGALHGISGIDVYRALVLKLLTGSGTTRRWPTDAEVIESAITKPVFKVLRTTALRLILERLELAQRDKKSETHELPSELQIEHVLPQAWSKNWQLNGKDIPSDIAEFTHFAKNEMREFIPGIQRRNNLKHTIGNLTLLNKYLNPAASNDSFEAKLVEYRHSVLRMNRYFEEFSDWDEEAIERRSKLLGELICKEWPRPADTMIQFPQVQS